MELNHVVIVGAGYVGGCTAAVMAQFCPEITFCVVDISECRIAAWNSLILPIYEPGLESIVSAVRGKNLFFSTNCRDAIAKSQMAIIAVNTPAGTSGRGYDLSAYETAAISIALHATNDMIVVEKSTVPVRTAERILHSMNANNTNGINFTVISNPEFLAEGTAIEDLTHPNRVLIGGDNPATDTLARLYLRWVPEERIIRTNIWSAELSKLASNAFLAQRISSINSLSSLCEKTGANINELAQVVGGDERIGSKFLKASLGFGGSCFKKDLLGLIYLCMHSGLPHVAKYWRAVLEMNEYQKSRFCDTILQTMFGTLRGKKIVMLGFAFKKNTSDFRESAAIDVAQFLIAEGAETIIYDPKVSLDSIDIKGIKVAGNPYTAAIGAHAIVITTEWDEFGGLDYQVIYKYMRSPAYIFDGRGILDLQALRDIGFTAYGIGQ